MKLYAQYPGPCSGDQRRPTETIGTGMSGSWKNPKDVVTAEEVRCEADCEMLFISLLDSTVRWRW